jgi:hypothetical protein
MHLKLEEKKVVHELPLLRLLPSNARSRLKFYIALGIAAYAIVWCGVILRSRVRHVPVELVVSDAAGYYYYLPSLIIDHDLDFTNQAVDQNLQPLEVARQEFSPSGLGNRYPIGVALTMAPSFIVAHAIALVGWHMTGNHFFTPNGYSPIYPILNLALVLMIDVIGLWSIDMLLEKRYAIRGRAIAATILCVWFGTSYIWYTLREPFMSHVIGTSWIAMMFYLTHQLVEDFSLRRVIWWRMPLLVFTAAMVALCRLTNVVILAPVGIYILYSFLRSGMIGQYLKLAPLVIIAAFPIFIQLLIWRQIHGHGAQASAEGMGYHSFEVFYWTRPALIKTLISSRHGLFFWTPLLIWSITGIVMAMRQRKDPLLIALLLSSLAMWYLNASWYSWWFGVSFGGRAFIELSVFFAIGFGFFFNWFFDQRPKVQRVHLGLILIAFGICWMLMMLKLVNKIPEDDYPLRWESRISTGFLDRI